MYYYMLLMLNEPETWKGESYMWCRTECCIVFLFWCNQVEYTFRRLFVKYIFSSLLKIKWPFKQLGIMVAWIRIHQGKRHDSTMMRTWIGMLSRSFHFSWPLVINILRILFTVTNKVGGVSIDRCESRQWCVFFERSHQS